MQIERRPCIVLTHRNTTSAGKPTSQTAVAFTDGLAGAPETMWVSTGRVYIPGESGDAVFVKGAHYQDGSGQWQDRVVLAF